MISLKVEAGRLEIEFQDGRRTVELDRDSLVDWLLEFAESASEKKLKIQSWPGSFSQSRLFSSLLSLFARYFGWQIFDATGARIKLPIRPKYSKPASITRKKTLQ